MKYKEIALLKNDELADRLRAEKDLLGRLRFAHAVSPIENPMKIRSSRRLFAQLSSEFSKRMKTS
ncbi:MAG: 50S ribosomal protein L29 [Cytophagales bacterium]